MTASKIFIIRHAEKPASTPNKTAAAGVTLAGQQDGESLTVRGWQRAGALARLFVPAPGAPLRIGLETPDFLFASAVVKHSNSARPQETISVLRALLGSNAKSDFAHPKSDVQEMTSAALSCQGVVLICWEHELIPSIASQIMGDRTTCPQSWPGDRFDLIWAFSRDPASGRWQFGQIPQLLLPGDNAEPIAA